MRLPLSWLKEFNETDLSIEDLANLLTRAGLEVETIERIGNVYLPVLSDIPIIGRLLFGHDPLVYLGILVLFGSGWFLNLSLINN